MSLASTTSLLVGLVRLGAVAAYDAVAQPRARRKGDVPHRIEAITTEWLTEALCGETVKARVAEFEFGPQTNGTTVRRRISLTYSGDAGNADLPSTMFAKSTPSFLHRVTHGLTRTMENEALFYRHIRPLLALEAPRGYHCAYDLRTGRSIQLLEDLVRTKGATFCSPDTYVARDKAEDIVGLLAALHGRFYADRDLGVRFPWLKTYPQWFRDGYEGFGLKRFHDKAMLEAVDVIPRELFDARDEIWPAQIRSLGAHLTQPPTLLHSDVHLGNWYVTREGRMGLCDWQCLSIGLWARDFAYAVTTSLTIADRRNWERELLTLYLDRLAAKTGTRIDSVLAFDLYRQQIPAALLMWTPTLCHSPLMPDMQPREIALEMVKRITTAMSDLESLQSLKVA